MRALLVLLLLSSCARTDGAALDPGFHGSTSCASDLACGPGRHCEDGLCAASCIAARDCGADRTCSSCGRCIASGARDDGCVAPTDRRCGAAADCGSLGDDWSCDPSGRCARACVADGGCAELGRGFGCAGGLCTRVCTRDDQCLLHGYAWTCALPASVDPEINAESDTPVRGTCKYDASRIALTGGGPADPPALQLQGVWGALLVSAVHTQGIPKIGSLHTASIQHLLARLRRDGDAVVVEEQWCTAEFRNFDPDDFSFYELFKVVVPDRNVDALRPLSNRIEVVPPLTAGASFVTGEQLDLRGAKLTNPATDPLPTRADLTHAWDQDHDGFPGLTSKITGAISGEIYQAQRWRATLHGVVVDRDHLHGLATGPTDQAILGGTNADVVNDSFSTEHFQADRSYFRAVRLRTDASCRDVSVLATTEGSWLFYEPHFDATKKP